MMNNKYNPHQGEDRARLMIALVIALGILLAFHFFVDRPRQEQMAQQQKKQELIQASKKADLVAAVDKLRAREDVLAEGGRIRIEGQKIRGSLSLKGARLDDVLLVDQFTTVEKKDNVALLSPAGTKDAYYVESGWLSANPAGQDASSLPGGDTPWRVAAGSPASIVSGGAPVVLEWSNGAGLTFQRSIALDENYLFTIRQKVVNNSGAEVALNAYHLTARHSLPVDYQGFFVLHEGPIAFLNGESQEPQYKDLTKGEKVEEDNVTGWLGFTDKYWMVGLLPEPKTTFNARMVATPGQSVGNGDKTAIFQADAVSATMTVPAQGEIEEVSYVYAGVKNINVMKDYEKKYGFDQLQLGLDFGMWYFITKPFFYVLHLLNGATGNIAIAILLMTIVVRLAVFPLSNKSFRSMAKMKIVAPKLKEIQEKYHDDKQKMQAEIFELYKKEDVNPFSGCWPMLIQIPIFFALYKVILISVELRHAPFWGWINDLSAPDPTSMFNLFGLIPWTPPQFLMIGAWPLLFCLSMVVQKRISPPMADATQEKLQTWFPYIVTFMMAHFASGLVIYWTWSNILSTLQQYYILKKTGGEETSLIRGHAARRKPKAEKKKKPVK